LPGQACTLEDQYVCDVAAGQTTCTFALPNKEPYPGLTYNTKTVILNPNLYDRQICTGNAVGCESWNSANLNAASVSYFKSPDGRVCEYREGVQIGSATYAGYFVQGTDAPCDPTFLINGNYYGIRKNADSNYQGYVGSCPAEQAGCTEYIDPVDYKARGPQSTLFDATRYYYIKDKNIDYTSCNGQASQKDGCVLMNDTSDLNLYYNAVGTYNDSTEQQYKSVPTKPGVCQYVIGCHQSSNVFADWDGADVQIPAGAFKAGWARFGAGATAGNLTQETNGSHNATFYAEGITTADADTLCVDNNLKSGSIWYQERGCNADTDCPSIAGVNGYCKSVQQANAVIKVARDRICGEWFACKSSTPQWDPRANRFRDTCDEVGLCDQQSDPTTTSGSTDITSCKHWITDPAEQQILSEAAYQDRSISWTGLEYTGYSIPHQFPASALTQATTGRYCAVLDGNGNKIACQSAADCPAIPNGPAHAPCQTEGSLAHDVGICDVDDGGYCYSVCGAITDFLKRVQCVFEQQSAQHPADGKCYSHRCYQSPFGSTVAETFDQPQPLGSQATLALSCRAYPESDSPVPNDVVTAWNADDTGLPSQVKQGFQNANTCLNGQDCECNYQKVLYGQAGKRYTSLNDDISQSIPGVCSGGTYDGLKCDPYIGAANLMKKRISSGIIQNLSCTTVDITSLDQSEGKCLPVKQNNYVRGLQGYCLERDEVTPIYGRQDSSPNLPGRACLTWFPVDRVSGQPDIYNQYTSATYELRDSYQCLVPQLYKVVHTFGEANDDVSKDVGPQGGTGAQFVKVDSTGQQVWVGCVGFSDTPNSANPATDQIYIGFPDGTESNLIDRATGNPFIDCPPSTGFIVASLWQHDDLEDVDLEGICPGTDYNADPKDELCTNGDNNFRYVCVPWGSVHTTNAHNNLGKECLPTDVQNIHSLAYHGPCIANWSGVQDPSRGVNGVALCNTSYMPKFKEMYWSATNSPRDWTLRNNDPADDGEVGMQEGDTTLVVVANQLCNDSALGIMSDCWKIDAPVTSGDDQPYNGAVGNAIPSSLNPVQSFFAGNGNSLPGLPNYLGCSVLAQVSKAGSSAEDTNKAYTNHLGGSQGLKPPGGSAAIGQANSPDVAAYTFDFGLNSVAIDPAYGGGSARGLDLNGLQWPVSSMYANQPKTGVLAPYVFIGSGGNICDAGGACYNYGVDATDKYNFGMTSLHQIFTKAYNYLGWSYYPTNGKSSKGYVELPEYAQTQDSIKYTSLPITYNPTDPKDITKTGSFPEFANLWSDTSTGNVSPQHLPKVVGVGTCDVDNHCYEDPNTSLNINGLSYGDIVGGGGWKRATFKFFAYAGLDADPIRDVRVIWDVKSPKADATTGNSGRFPGLYKNHRGFENIGGVQTPVCGNGSDFGTTPEACDDSAPFTFVHNYTCNEASPHCEDGSDSCWNPNYVLPGENVGKPACVYNPGVYVLNNWGLCLGTCGTAPGGILCSTNGGSSETIDNASAFADPNADDLDECTLGNQNLLINGNQPYIKYSGNIVVYPEQSN
jgi:hypothetical protein